MKGLILAGGHGTKLRPLTHTGPKQLIPIANKPNILYCLEDLKEVGIKDIGVILGNIMPEKVKEFLGDGSKYGVKITYIVQGEPKGIAHAVGLAEEFMNGEAFVVYLGDNILKGGIGGLVQALEKSDAEVAIGLCKVKNTERFGVAVLNKKGEIIKLVEKPKERISDLALIGVYLFRKSIFDVIKTLKPSKRNELEITEAIDKLVQFKRKVHAYIVTGWWKDTGRPEDILEANRLVLDDLTTYNKGKTEKNVSIMGKVGIDEESSIKSGSVIRGPVIIGKNCVIGPGTYIGPYTAIGDDCTIINGDIESSIVMEGAKITCKKKIVDSLIGKNSVISSKDELLPNGHRLVLGENTIVNI